MSKSSQKKIAAVLASLSRAFDDHEAAQRSSPPSRLFSPFHTAQPTLTFLLTTQPLVTQLVSLQAASAASPPSPPSAPMADRLAAFTAWLTTAAPRCGIGETFAFQAGDGTEGNGVVALLALPPSSLVMSIPRSIMITASCFSSASSSFFSPPAAAFAAFLSSLSDPLLSNLPSLVLSLLLLYEKQRVSPPSPLRPYLAVLPSDFSLPLFVPPTELHRLGRSPALLSVVNVQYNILKQYVYLQQLLSKERILAPLQSAAAASSSASSPPLSSFLSALPHARLSFTYDEFRWAVAVVMTRQNKIPAASPPSSSASEVALIPGWDLANHRSSLSSINTFYSPVSASSDTFSHPHELTAAGQAVHLFYGHRSSRELFVYSGFIDDDSERREYEMMLRPDDDREEEAAATAGGWGKIREVMRKKAGLDAGGAVTLPLPLTEEDWEAELQRRRQREQQRDASRQAAWEQYRAGGGSISPSSSPRLPASASPSSLSSAEDNERRLSSLLSFLRIAAVSSKQEAMDALRLQTMQQHMPRVSRDNERRALQLLMTALEREESGDEQGGLKAAEEELRAVRAARQSAAGHGSVEEQRTELMLRMKVEGLHLLREARDAVRAWQRRLEAEEGQPAAAPRPQAV